MNILAVSNMETSLDFLDDNIDNIEAKRSDLTSTKMTFKKYSLDSSKLRYKMVKFF
jgi:hypothetical protein